MGMLIEYAKSNAQLQVIWNLETEIFGGEKGIIRPPLAAPAEGTLYRLLARDETTAAPIATLSVAEGEIHPELLRQKSWRDPPWHARGPSYAPCGAP